MELDAPGCEAQALVLSLLIEESIQIGEPMGGVALGWANAYDKFDFQALSDVLLRLGVPRWIWLPLLDMYQGSRQVRIDGALGSSLFHIGGILVGCPMTTLLTDLVQWVIYSRVKARNPWGTQRGWVDDRTHYSDDMEVVQDLVTDTLDFAACGEWAYGLHVPKAKSTTFGSYDEAQQVILQLDRDISLPAKVGFKHFGIARGRGAF